MGPISDYRLEIENDANRRNPQKTSAQQREAPTLVTIVAIAPTAAVSPGGQTLPLAPSDEAPIVVKLTRLIRTRIPAA